MAIRKIFKQDEFRELGFGNRVVEQDQRLMNKDGSSNVRRRGLPFLQSLNIYHTLITMPWWRFNLLILAAYVVANLFFATLYFVFCPDQINGMVFGSEFTRFMEFFYFSSQSLTTVGYGRLNPAGIGASTLAAIESMLGLMAFALATGLLYGRFSRPVAKVLFSKNAIIAPYRGATGLMLRIANSSKSELVDIQATVIMSYIPRHSHEKIRKYANLKLELTKVTLLSMSWTIVHPIDEESPMNNWTDQDFAENDVEILVLIQAYEETFAQTVHTRSSYRSREIVCGARFNSMVDAGPNGSVYVALDRLNDFTRVTLETEMTQTA